MTNLLAKLLSPILSPMGVSQADLLSYLELCIGYVYVILFFLVAMIVVLVAAGKAKKGVRGLIRWNAVLAMVAILAIIVNLICFGPVYTNISGALNASKANLSEETVSASKDIIRKVGDEGLVLVKNSGLLPLSSNVNSLNVFGWSSTNPVFGGTGSGSSDSSTAVSILQSLNDAGYQTNEALTAIYTEYRTSRPDVNMGSQDWTLPEPTADVYTADVMNQAKGFSDTAVIVISRSGGENADLPMDMYSVIHGTYNIGSQISSAPNNYSYFNGSYTNNGDYDDFEKGEHYLELSVTEENLVDKVCSEFNNVIVIVNANNAMELGWVDEYPQIGAVLLAPGAGNTGFSGLGKIISGEVNPSGRTVDTYVKDLTKTPTWNNFGSFPYNNLDDFKQQMALNDGAYEGNVAFVNYVEGIYVGYKFYETAAQEGLINYDNYVQYPFGHGLSYTTFSQEITNFSDNGNSISLDVKVTNTGKIAGKEVVEVYFEPPYTNGGIEKASVNLVQFTKTAALEPNDSTTVHFDISKEEFAAYDSDGLKVKGGGYILEAGDYTVSIRSNSHTVLDAATFTINSDISYNNGRSSDLVPAVNQFQDYSRGNFVQLSRRDSFANYQEATAAPANSAYEMSAEARAAVEASAVGYYDPTLYNDANDQMPTTGAKNGLKLIDLVGKSYDDPQWEQLLDQLTFQDMVTMINVGGWQTAKIKSVGKIATSDCDGPAGLSNFVTGAYGTAYPSEVLMAQTWNKDLIYEMGEAMGQEYAEVNNFGWYGPAMNTHRSAFAGRNFEYYSEDGVLAGYIGAAEINGAATKGVYPYIKHFVLNDQETNRCAFLLTYASEQAIREIYLKPFELCVKNYTGTPLAVMSSFNFIGTVPSCANPHLLNNVLRDEWGFVGMVESDYDGSYGYMISDHCTRSGNDLMLGFGTAESNKFTDQSATAHIAMRQSCKNILYTIGNSGYYANGDPSGGMDNMTRTFLMADIAIGVVLVAAEVLLIMNYRKKKQ